MKKDRDIKRLMKGEYPFIGSDVARTVLYGLSKIYGYAIHRRNMQFTKKANNPHVVHYAEVPVISIGNITAGGTGKTPFAVYVCRLLQSWGYRPAVLMRGYKATKSKVGCIVSDGREILATAEESGDEAYLLAKLLPEVPILIGSNRVKLAKEAKDKVGADVIVLDDGFQHRRLGRDLDIVLIDATNPFGFGYMLPRGLLREPIASLERADIIVITKTDQANKERLPLIESVIAPYLHGTSPVHAAHKVGRPYPLQIGADADTKGRDDISIDVSRQAVYAVAGIGSPQSFLESLREIGATVVDTAIYRDHHIYTAHDVEKIVQAAEKVGATVIMTTEKDAVKLAPMVEKTGTSMPIYILPIELQIIKNTSELEKTIAQVLEKNKEGICQK